MPINRRNAKHYRNNHGIYLKSQVIFGDVNFSDKLQEEMNVLRLENNEISSQNTYHFSIDPRRTALENDKKVALNSITPQILKIRDDCKDSIEFINSLTLEKLAKLGLDKFVDDQSKNDEQTVTYTWEMNIVAEVNQNSDTIKFNHLYKLDHKYLPTNENSKSLEKYKNLKSKDCLTNWGQKRVDKQIARLEERYPHINSWYIETELSKIIKDYTDNIDELKMNERVQISTLERIKDPIQEELDNVQAEYDQKTSTEIIANNVAFVKEHQAELAQIGKHLNLNLDTVHLLAYLNENQIEYTSVETLAAVFLGLQSDRNAVLVSNVNEFAEVLIEELYQDQIIETQKYDNSHNFKPTQVENNETCDVENDVENDNIN